MSRAQVAAATGLTRATVSSLVDDLVSAGILLEGQPVRGLAGRPGSPLSVDPRGAIGIGVEISVDYLAGCVIDLAGVVRERTVTAADNREAAVDEVLDQVADLVSDLLTASGPISRVAGLTVALPGLVDPEDGLLLTAPNLPRWKSVPVIAAIRRRVPDLAPVLIDNEANLAALGELWYGAVGSMDFLQVSGEIGVGAGIVIEGQLYRGKRGFAGELGHVVVNPGGPKCGCGSRGCLEQVAGQHALLRAAGLAGITSTSTRDPDGPVAELVRRATAGDNKTLTAISAAADALATALSGVINVLDIPTLVLSGLYAALAPWLVSPLSEGLTASVVTHAWSPISINVSTLGSDAALLGAAGTAVQRVLADPAELTSRPG